MECDVVIIGGGPAGSTVGTLLKKHNPSLDVVILEMAKFPRDHVGESHLPVISQVLNEMEVWDKVEAADFPIKVGATLKWGLRDDEDPYHFYFIPGGNLREEARPAKFEGQRKFTAFQVDRSVYDKILLEHAREKGCRVYEEVKVTKVVNSGDRIDHFEIKSVGPSGSALDSESTIKARYYVDASGGSSIVRSTLGVGVDSPTALRNIAIWDYWQDAEWAETIGNGGTYIQIMSFGWGWLWFIPISATRTSLGLVTSAEYYKQSGKSIEDLYLEAIAGEPRIRELVKQATRENVLQATKDWSYIADRVCGENWFLAGDACGFADPILSAGMSLAHVGAKRVAYSILELERGELDSAWVKSQYERVQRKNIANHIRFADYWYSANGRFTDLQGYCSEIAKAAGISLNAESAFRWLATGGFADEISGIPFAGTYRVSAIKQFTGKFSGKEAPWTFAANNIFELDTEGAVEVQYPIYMDGRISQVPCLTRGDQVLPIYRIYGSVYHSLQRETEIMLLAERFIYQAKIDKLPFSEEQVAGYSLEALEALVAEGWVKASYRRDVPLFPIEPDPSMR